MKRVITTVGTSIFNNYLHEQDDIRNYYEFIEKEPHSKWDSQIDRISRIRQSVTAWAHENDNASAEIKSLKKLLDMLGETLEVYLLATDTITSRLAAEITKEVLSENQEIKIFFNAIQDVIRGLQVENYEVFVKQGSHEFVRRINSIAGGFFSDLIFNISGGYKGLIPFMTIMAQVHICDIVYIFEESETLIRIPRIPVNLDYELFEKYYPEIELLDRGIENYRAEKNKDFQCFQELEDRGIAEILGNCAFLSPIGTIFFERFKDRLFVFFCPNEVWQEIQKQEDIKRILREKFSNPAIRTNKTEKKKDHTVFDDGDNNNRIYYFETEGRIYIYKTFEDEEAARDFISTKVNKEKIINNSVERRILC